MVTPTDEARQVWHDAAGEVGAHVIAAMEAALAKARAGQPAEPAITLTEVEARVVWNVLHKTWAPQVGYPEFISAMAKLCQMGGGYICRDCTARGTHSSRYGGFACGEHKATEQARFTQETDK